MNEYRKIITKILKGEIKTESQLNEAKRKLSAKLKLNRFIRNSDILKFAEPEEKSKLRLLLKRPARINEKINN